MSQSIFDTSGSDSAVAVVDGPTLDVRERGHIWHVLQSFARKKPLGAIGAVVLLAFMVMALLAPRLATHDPDLNYYRARMHPPSAEYWFGTDNFGRDIYSRVVYGARISMSGP